MSGERKSLAFVDSALDDLRDFPEDARRQAGFEKKTQKTAKKDIDLAKKRYKAVAREQAK